MVRIPRFHIRTLMGITAVVAVGCWALILLVEHWPMAVGLVLCALMLGGFLIVIFAWTGRAVWGVVRTVFFPHEPIRRRGVSRRQPVRLR